MGIPGNADVTATVAIGFTAMNPPLDFTLEDMKIDAHFSMEAGPDTSHLWRST